MATLFIIGNGFDIQNGLPTSYWNFYQKYSDRLNEYFVYFPDFWDDQEWSNFEENLGTFDKDNFCESAVSKPSIGDMSESWKHLYGYEDEVSQRIEELEKDIRKAFTDWIRSIDVKKANRIFEFPKGSKFINFNYTSTLQAIYLIPNEDVLHIHGRAAGHVIFGHNMGDGNKASSRTPNYDEPWFGEVNKVLASVTDQFYKPVNEVLEKHRSELEGYDDIKKIVVIGHSINDIDFPYFKCILDAYPDAVWRNWNYIGDDDGVSETHRKLLSLGVPDYKLYSLQSKKLGKAYPISQ